MFQAVTQQANFLGQVITALLPAATPSKQESSAISQLRNKSAVKEAEGRIEKGLAYGFISEEEAIKLRNIKSPELRLLATDVLNKLCVSKSYAEDLLAGLEKLKIADINFKKIKSEKDPLIQMQLLEELKYAVFAHDNLERAKEFGFLSSEAEKNILQSPKNLHRLRYHFTKELDDKVECEMYSKMMIEEAKELKLLDRTTLSLINAFENPRKKYDFLIKKINPLITATKKLNGILDQAKELEIITIEERKNIDGYSNLLYRERKVEPIEKLVNEVKEADYIIKKAFDLKLIDADTYALLKEKGYQDRIKSGSQYKEVVNQLSLSEEIIKFSLELDIINQEQAKKLNDIISPKERYDAAVKYQSLCVERLQAYTILYKAVEYNHLELNQVNDLIQANDQQQIVSEAEKFKPQNDKAKEVIDALRFCFEYGLIEEYKLQAIRAEKDVFKRHDRASEFIEYFKHKEQHTDLSSIVIRFANLP